MADALAYGERAVIAADEAGDSDLRTEALMSLAGSMAISGDNLRALQALDEASGSADERLSAEIESQRGAVLSRMGEMKLALEAYSTALPLLLRHDNRRWIANVLHNRAMTRLALGQLEEAERDFVQARDLYVSEKSLSDVAGADHGLGMVAFLRGDLPLALSLLDQSVLQYRELLGSASESQVSRCEVLLSAGLFREALSLAKGIVIDLQRAGLAEDEAEAHLAGAQAALLAGKLDEAVGWANRAEEMFAAQRRPTWAATAHLVSLQAQFQRGDVDPGFVKEARGLAVMLEEHGHDLAATRARFLAGSAAQRLSRRQDARRDLGHVARRSTGPIEVRLQAYAATALLRLMDGDLSGVDAAARSGLDLLDEYQAALGATDIRLGVERHAKELGALGLGLAIQSKRARRVLGWMERSKGTALTHRPVAPPADLELAEELASLRQVAAELRTADDERAGDLLRQQRHLQESIRSQARRVEGQSRAGGSIDLSELADSVGNQTLIEFASVDGELWAVLIRNGRYHLRRIGPQAEITAELQSLRFLLRRLTRGRGSLDTVAEVARRLDSLLFAKLRPPGPLVIVPTADLHVTPWWILPGCQGRPMTIAPSARLWFRAVDDPIPGRGVVVAAGPELEVSDTEVTEVDALYPASTMFSSAESDPVRVQAHMDGAAVVHIASHAYFQHENPMFSALRLADGDLYVYDIERLNSAPRLVVLSACDSGFSDSHPGEELMGLSAALLAMGTKSIIASVGLVPDSEATKDLMVALHRGLISGLSPSQALHRAQLEAAETPEGYVAASSFICIGAG
jgi:tetratricopeptide (TPR) repeat protein